MSSSRDVGDNRLRAPPVNARHSALSAADDVSDDNNNDDEDEDELWR